MIAPATSYAGTAIILGALALGWLCLKRRPLPWIMETDQAPVENWSEESDEAPAAPTRLTALGRGLAGGLIAALLLLWAPRILPPTAAPHAVVSEAQPAAIRAEHAPHIVLKAAPERIYAGESSRLAVLLDDAPAGEGYACQWTLEAGSSGEPLPETCDFQYTGVLPSDPSGNEQKEMPADIRVRVLNEEGREVADQRVRIVVVRPPAFFYSIVLDASARMAAEPLGRQLLALAGREIADSAQNIIGSARLGIQVFGGTAGAAAQEPCNNAEEVLPLTPLTVLLVRERLDGLRPGGQQAPLALAWRQSLAALARHMPGVADASAQAGGADARFLLLTVTAGGDTCEAQDWAASLARLGAAISEAGLNDQWISYKFLTLHIGLAFSEAEAQRFAASPESLEHPHLVVLARDPESLARILQAAARLSALSASGRVDACAALIRPFMEQRDESSARKMEKYCESLRP